MNPVSTRRIIIAIMILLCTGNSIHAQELIGKVYKVEVPVLVRNVYTAERFKKDSALDTTSVKFCEAKKGYIFQVIDIKDNAVLIRWWDFTESSVARQQTQDSLTRRDMGRYNKRDTGRYNQGDSTELISYKNTHLDYEISLSDLNSKCIPYYGNDNSFTWGAVTMPVKLRFGNRSNRYFSFQESLNIGIAAGWSWQKEGIHQKSRNVLVSLGVSNVALDSPDFKMNNKNERFQPNVRSTAAVTIAGGYLFQFDNFQVGAFAGSDFLPYEFGRQWLHRGKPWIGIGLGMSLFNRNQQTAGTGKNKDE